MCANSWIFSFLSVPMCRTRPTKICIYVSQLYPKLRIMDKKGRFHDTSAICQEWAPIRLLPYRPSHVTLVIFMSMHNERKKNMVKSTVSVLFAYLCTKDLETRWAAPWSNCKHSHALSANSEASMTNVQNVHCCASSTVELNQVCHEAIYFRMNTHRESKTHAKERGFVII